MSCLYDNTLAGAGPLHPAFPLPATQPLSCSYICVHVMPVIHDTPAGADPVHPAFPHPATQPLSCSYICTCHACHA